jgi:anaerobic magnesium-protoporphyrin IX monomethyl ester cyclase
MKPSILFVNPIPVNGVDYGFTTPPIGLSSLAATVKKAGYKIECFDMQIPGRTEERLLKEIQEKKPDVICVTMTSMVANYSFDLLKKMKGILPNAWYIAGGVHPTVRPKGTLCAGFDLVCLGEGEKSLLEVLDHYSDKDIKAIKGIAWLDDEGQYHAGQRADRVRNLDALPMPEIEAFGFPNSYTQFSLTTSRGCPHACLYCGSKTIFGRTVEYHSPDRVIMELSRAINLYNQRSGVFVDDTLNVNPRRFDKILDGIIQLRQDSGVDFKWSMNSRIDSGKRTDWDKVARAGCQMVSMGIETGSERILRAIDKGINLNDVVSVASSVAKAGLEVRTTWIVGLPGNLEDQLQSIPLMKALAPYVTSFTVHNLLPLPGTPYGDSPNSYGIHFNEVNLMKSISFNALPPPEVLTFDYLTRDEMMEAFSRMESALCALGFKSSSDAAPGDKIIRTPINRGTKLVEAVLQKPSAGRDSLNKLFDKKSAPKGIEPL